MANTSPDGLWSPDATDPLILRTLTAEMQASNQVAFGNRQLYSYRWSNSAARNAQAGMRDGDTGYQIDHHDVWRYWGGWTLESRRATSFLPRTGSFAVGNGSINGSYSVANSSLTMQINVTIGTTTSFSGWPIFFLPLTAQFNTGDGSIVGHALMKDASAGTLFVGGVLQNASDAISPIFFTSWLQNSTAGFVDQNGPVPWSTGDSIKITATLLLSTPMTA